MRDILARCNDPALRAFVTEGTLFAFDFDGTLAPLVAHPASVEMRETTRRLLTRIARQAQCAVVSGRRRADVQRHLHGIPLAAVIGNHGAEDGRTRARAPRVGAWRDTLAATLEMPGVWVEDKGLSIAVHYRAAADRVTARNVIWRAASRLPEARVFDGNAVVNVVPRGSTNKGQALETLLRRLGCDRALFVGDDQTDEDAFALATTPAVLAVRVGWSRSSRAPYFIRGQGSIDGLLARTLTLLETDAVADDRDRVTRRQEAP